MNKLQERRVFLGLTQPDVSRELRKVDPRMDVGMVSRFERGACLPTAVGGRGYYLTDDPDEIDRHYHGEYARAMSILVSTKGERRYLKKRGRL